MTQPLFLSPQDWRQYYRYTSGLPEARLLRIKKSRRFTAKEIRLHFPRSPAEDQEDLTLTIYEPHLHSRAPTILVNSIFRGQRIAKIFARYFARKGFNAVVLHHDPLAYDFRKNFDQIELYLKKAVIKNLKALDWIAQHEKTESAKIGTFGISFGAIIGSVVAAIDSRPRCHVIALAGAPGGPHHCTHPEPDDPETHAPRIQAQSQIAPGFGPGHPAPHQNRAPSLCQIRQIRKRGHV